jgi:hypothetical protein
MLRIKGWLSSTSNALLPFDQIRFPLLVIHVFCRASATFDGDHCFDQALQLR